MPSMIVVGLITKKILTHNLRYILMVKTSCGIIPHEVSYMCLSIKTMLANKIMQNHSYIVEKLIKSKDILSTVFDFTQLFICLSGSLLYS